MVDLKKLPLGVALSSLLTLEQQRQLKQDMPESVVIPTGRSVRLDYTGEQVVLAAKLQELFGLKTLPALAGTVFLQWTVSDDHHQQQKNKASSWMPSFMFGRRRRSSGAGGGGGGRGDDAAADGAIMVGYRATLDYDNALWHQVRNHSAKPSKQETKQAATPTPRSQRCRPA